jgi:3-phenylpropionate/trans-cinnamate dioxygenase ferredoxin reductase component
MSAQPVFLIIGASLAGAKAAEELRTRGFDGRVVLIGAEPERPYERPPLTKDYLRGESEREKAYVHPDGFYAQQEIELETGVTVTGIEPGASRVTLGDGRVLGYDRLLLATGAEPRLLHIPGADLDRVCYLRTLADCDLLRAQLDAGGRVVVVGAGWIGAEFAASARQRGLEVTVIDPQPLPSERLFGRDVASFYHDVHARHGIEFLLGDGVEAFEGNGAVSRVRTASGRRVECDFAVVGIGVVPRTGLASEAGLEVSDVANAWHPFYHRRIRVEHWANALNQGPAAARAMLGDRAGYDHIPYFYSDQYDVGMEYSGHAPEWDEVVFRGDPADGEFIAFWLRGGCVAAGMNVNVWDVNEHIQALIRAGKPVEAAALADPGTTLESLVGELAAGG